MEVISVFNADGQKQGNLDLGFDLPKREISTKAYSLAIRSLLINWRQGTVACKDRSEVAFSGKKPWKQKGTGRARAGTASSPLWRKGGVIFGPQPRTRKLKLSANQKVVAFNNIFYSMLEGDKIKCVDFSSNETNPKTKDVYKILKNLNLHKDKTVIFLDFNDSKSFSSFRNIPNVNILFFDQPNAFDLTCVKNWVFLKKDSDLFKSMVAKWN
ncbi:MAG: 50S ribosomal protein L4 [candidate division TM6 bacterium GW2011_GWE2_31_21]|nr:MAG: 50S ribosomal protein L4 [candidate division TM6 bacterium GW2011_GWE2_31_21]KKP53126.1 MAG: 50S ribosomal protein L4 [candidate division TM6 bacterium GW2011_GWF2_33_332]